MASGHKFGDRAYNDTPWPDWPLCLTRRKREANLDLLHPWPQTYDRYSALHTQNPMYLNGGILSGVWILSVECWVSVISLGPGSQLLTITQHSTLKTPDSDPCISMGESWVWKDSHSMLMIPYSNTWIVECGVLSICHKFGACSCHYKGFPLSLTSMIIYKNNIFH